MSGAHTGTRSMEPAPDRRRYGILHSCRDAAAHLTSTAVSIAAVVVCTVGSIQAAPFWSTAQGDGQRTGRRPCTIPERIEHLWTVRPGDTQYFSPPVIAEDGTLYVTADITSGNSQLYALAPNGTVRWNYPVTDDGTMLVAGKKHVYAVNPDGTEKWTYATDGIVGSAPAIAADGCILFGTSSVRLICLTAGGLLAWEKVIGSGILGSPVTDAAGNVLIGASNGHLYLLTGDGDPVWDVAVGGAIQTTPAVGRDVVPLSRRSGVRRGPDVNADAAALLSCGQRSG